MSDSYVTRRAFLAHAARAGAAAALAGVPASAAEPETQPPAYGKAESCIFIWLGGGASQIDTWDPKRRGDPKKKKAGSAYDAIETAIPGVKVCEHLSRTAAVLDRCAIVRTVHHGVIDEHAAATNRVHTGRPTSSTVVYPSIGSVVAYRKPAATRGVPPYVIMGYPNLTRGPGFLGPKYGFVYLLQTHAGPQGLARPPFITAERQQRREALLAQMRGGYLRRRPGDRTVRDYAEAAAEGLTMASPKFLKTFDLDSEPASLRASYGSEFGLRCLLARRLVASGARFIEVSHNLNFINGTGWDTHNQGQRKQHGLIQGLDKAFSTLIRDLEARKMLDTTLVVVATEFGRPAKFDGGGGRGHQSSAFSIVLAGGGLRTGRAVGETDELAKRPVSHPVSVPDLHATIYAAMGINPHKNLYDGDRPVPTTDNGKPIRELFV